MYLCVQNPFCTRVTSSSELHNVANRPCEMCLSDAIEMLKECSALCVLMAGVLSMQGSAPLCNREEAQV
jgi:hypothetical protein